jgi:hypothetical protein
MGCGEKRMTLTFGGLALFSVVMIVIFILILGSIIASELNQFLEGLE